MRSTMFSLVEIFAVRVSLRKWIMQTLHCTNPDTADDSKINNYAMTIPITMTSVNLERKHHSNINHLMAIAAICVQL